MEDKKFYPNIDMGIDKSTILELINTELIESQEISMEEIKLGDPRLTDEFCREIVDAWIQGEFPNLEPGELWQNEDDISEEWCIKIRNHFK